MREDQFNLNNYKHIIVTDNTNEVLISIDPKHKMPVVIKDGLKVILEPRDGSKTIELD